MHQEFSVDFALGWPQSREKREGHEPPAAGEGAVVASVSIQNVRKLFGHVEVVRGVSLDIRPGEFIVLVGPSGCGKSTTLRMVAGLDEISDGQITIDDRVINDLAPKDRDVAMVFQNYALYPHLSVFENICFGLRLKRTREDEVRRAVLQAAGSDMSKAVKTTVFIKNMDDFAAVNAIYAGYFTEPFPARSCVEVARLPKDVLVECEVVAEA